MTKMQRFEAIRRMQRPDFMPVWPRLMSYAVYAMGWTLSDVTGTDWYDSDRCAEAVLWSIRHLDFDVALPAYMDCGFGVPFLGGAISIPRNVGEAVGIRMNQRPVRHKGDWPKVRARLAHFDMGRSDPRMRGALESIRNVAGSVGKEIPLVASAYLAATVAMLLFRTEEEFLHDMSNDPAWVDEMCRAAADWTMDWVRAQYEAGANSVTFISDPFGIHLIDPEMGTRFNLPFLCELVRMVKKEFGQGVWLHIHGNFKSRMGYPYLTRIVRESGIEGLHLDESHPAEWIKKWVVDRFGMPACIIYDCFKIRSGPPEKIRREVKDMISNIGEGAGMLMAPCCQILPGTPDSHVKEWIDATHELGRYPLSPKI